MTDPLANSVLRNPDDPLRKTGPDASRNLLIEFGKVANGYPMEAVLQAAADVILNAIRQTHAKRSGAKDAFDAITTRTRDVLLSQHYDAMGRRRNVFPFDQKIEMPTVVNESKIWTP